MRGCGAVMIYILNYFHCQPLSRCENRSKYSGGNACLKHPRHPEASSLSLLRVTGTIQGMASESAMFALTKY